MKVSLKWLSDYVDINLSPQEIAGKLTMAGIEVVNIQSSSSWDKVVVGEVVAVEPHPNADRLRLATVDVGAERIMVVCGASNISPSQKVPFARAGAELFDGHTEEIICLKPAKIRGVSSVGMVCSERELGISDNCEGIMILPHDAPVGMSFGKYMGDTFFELEVTPNRSDCLSVIGIAREIAALTGQSLQLPNTVYQEAGEEITSFVSVEIADSELCPRYCAGLISGVTVGSSPLWLQQRLSNYGMRSINNVVDVTNYVMLEYGQPLHAFDYEKIAGRQIVVRRAVENERLNTLDGEQHILNPDVLVIADTEKATAIAGIMGGAESEMTENTSVILIESANFDYVTVRRGSDALHLQSEASIRFSKGLSHRLPLPALKRAMSLLLEVAGGQAASGIVDVYAARKEETPIALTCGEVKRLSSLEMNIGEISKVLDLLGFACRQSKDPHEALVSVPYWRNDIHLPADLVEEVVRIVGYDRIPLTSLSAALPTYDAAAGLNLSQRRVSTILVGMGFQEVLTYSLTSLEMLQKVSPVQDLIGPMPLKLANPMTQEQEYLRTTLRSGVLSTLARNQKLNEETLRLFETGKVFLPDDGGDLPREKRMLCAALCGTRTKASWHDKGEQRLDFFDAKGMVEAVLQRLFLQGEFKISDDPSLTPGNGAEIIIDGKKLGVVGELHPRVARSFGLSGTIYLFEMDLDEISFFVTGEKKFQPVSKFPGVVRDIAIVVKETVPYGEVKKNIEACSLVTQIELFDLYTGKQIPPGKKSFAVRVFYQSPDHTLTDEEVDKEQQKIMARLSRKLDVVLRS